MKNDPRPRILVIEDERHIAEGLRLNLSLQGLEVKTAFSGGDGLQQWRRWRPDLIVLDIMLPDVDGLTVLQSIRLEDERLPILILSAKASAADKVMGLAHGVDDYLAKPFDLSEFLLRVNRLLKRAQWTRSAQTGALSKSLPLGGTYAFGPNRIDFETATAHGRRMAVKLTEQELKLLKLFILHQKKPLARQKILEIGWGYTGGMTTRTVDNFIVRFRKYFEEDPRSPVYFKSIRSVGYLFDPDPPAS